MSDIHIKGGAELQKILSQLPVSIEKNVMRGAVSAGARVIRDKAKQNAPLDDGDLKKSIRASSRYEGNGRITGKVKAGGRRTSKRRAVWYASMIEFGVAAHKIFAKAGGVLNFNGITATSVQHTGFTARPFMRPAFDSESKHAVQAAGNYIRKRLAKFDIKTPDFNVLSDEE